MTVTGAKNVYRIFVNLPVAFFGWFPLLAAFDWHTRGNNEAAGASRGSWFTKRAAPASGSRIGMWRSRNRNCGREADAGKEEVTPSSYVGMHILRPHRRGAQRQFTQVW